MRYGFEPSIQLYHTLFNNEEKRLCDALIEALFACDELGFEQQLTALENLVGMPALFPTAPYLVKAKRELTLNHIHVGVRNVVFCSGMHVEHILKRGQITQPSLLEATEKIQVLYDLSKIIVNENTRKDMQLTASDALMAYLAAGICTR